MLSFSACVHNTKTQTEFVARKVSSFLPPYALACVCVCVLFMRLPRYKLKRETSGWRGATPKCALALDVDTLNCSAAPIRKRKKWLAGRHIRMWAYIIGSGRQEHSGRGHFCSLGICTTHCGCELFSRANGMSFQFVYKLHNNSSRRITAHIVLSMRIRRSCRLRLRSSA